MSGNSIHHLYKFLARPQPSFLLRANTSASKEKPAQGTSEHLPSDCWVWHGHSELLALLSLSHLWKSWQVHCSSPFQKGSPAHSTAEKSALTYSFTTSQFLLNGLENKTQCSWEWNSGRHHPSCRGKPGLKSFQHWVYIKDSILLSSRVFLPESRRNEDMKQHEAELFSVETGIKILKWVVENLSRVLGEISTMEHRWTLPGSDVENIPWHGKSIHLSCFEECQDWPKASISGQSNSHEHSPGWLTAAPQPPQPRVQPVASLFSGLRGQRESESHFPVPSPWRFCWVKSSLFSYLQTLQCFPVIVAPRNINQTCLCRKNDKD